MNNLIAVNPYHLSTLRLGQILFIPLFFGILIYVYFHASLPPSEYTLKLFYIGMVFDFIHIVSTSVYVRTKLFDVKKLTLSYYISYIAIAIFFNYMLFFIDRNLFISTLAYLVLFHTVRQQVGWLRNSFDTKIQRFSYFAYEVLVYSLSILPILYWQTGVTTIGKNYIFNNSIYYFLPASLALPILILMFVTCAVCLTWIMVTRSLYFKPLLVALHTSVMYAVGLILNTEPIYFAFILVWAHAGGYLMFLLTQPQNNSHIKSHAKIFFAVLTVGITALVFLVSSKLESILLLLPLRMAPSTAHVIFDTIIWKTRKIKT